MNTYRKNAIIVGVARNARHKSSEIKGKLLRLTLAGGIVFWVTTIATSLLPIAAEYRAAFSNWSIQSVWLGSLVAGLLIACCVSYLLLHYSRKIPTKRPILKSLVLSSGFLVLATIMIDVPKCFQGYGDVMVYFLVGFMFNAARFLLLGTATGCQYKRLLSKGSP